MIYLLFLIFIISCSVSVHGRKPTDRVILQNMSKKVSKILKIVEDKQSQTGPLRNLAYRKTTYQSSTYKSAISYKAVDGISNSHWKGGSCAHTGAEHHPYWYVDLGKEHIIERIRITNRGDCCYERLHNVAVTVAGHDKRFDVLCGSFNGPGKASERVLIQCPRGTKGRYVRLQITKGSNNLLTLCEVEVMGY